MTRTRKDEARLLSADESELVQQSRQSALRLQSDGDLVELVRHLRERRDRAREIARQQRREMRGKAAASGARPATDNTGTRKKSAVLAAALKRVSKERERRRQGNARSDLSTTARRALALKRAAQDRATHRPASRTAGEGMRPVPNEAIAPSGALQAEGQRPALERSRKVR